MKRKDLVREFYGIVLVKERERTGYATPGKIWCNGEPKFTDDFIEHVVKTSIQLADQFIRVEKKISGDNWMNEEI
jgi:hypothetical protein